MVKNIFNITSPDFTKTVLLFVLIISVTACKDPVNEWVTESRFLVMSEYVQQNSEFSEFGKMLEHTNLYSLLDTRGPFTLFLPTNEAIDDMYTEMEVNSFTEFTDTTYVYKFIYNHLIGSTITSAGIGLGALRETNVLGDFIVSDFDSDGNIRLNKKAFITKRDIELSNGFIHIIDQTIPIIDKSVFQTLKDMPGDPFSIFVEGLEKTELSDTLDLIQFNFSNLVARTRFTILAVADTTFNRYGIKNYDELLTYFTDDPSTIKSLDNSFYQFMVYHCIKETYYLSDLQTGTYPVISQENNILMTISDDYKLNNEGGVYTGFVTEESNYPAKNGAIHTIDDLLEPIAPKAVEVVWNVFDHLEIISGDWYLNYFKKWGDEKDENGQSIYFENINFQGDYLQYYWKGSSNPKVMKGDGSTGYKGNLGALNMMGHWWIEFTTPKIMKGKYEINLTMTASGGFPLAIYVDGVKTQRVSVAADGFTNNIGTFEFATTKAHKIKVVTLNWTTMFWRDITFSPVN